jgi:hypothetical protein
MIVYGVILFRDNSEHLFTKHGLGNSLALWVIMFVYYFWMIWSNPVTNCYHKISLKKAGEITELEEEDRARKGSL